MAEYTVSVTGDLQGTAREQEFKEHEIVTKVREFVRTLEGVSEAEVVLEQRGTVDLLDQQSPKGIYDPHHQAKIDAANA